MSTGQWIGAILGAVVGFLIGGWYGAVYGAILGYSIGGYIDPVKPDIKVPGAPAQQGLQVMSNQIGLPIYDVLGTAKITGQLLFFGKEFNQPVYYRIAKGKYGISGYKYFASWALGVCMGPVDVLYTVFRDQDPVWSGELTRPESGGEATIQIEGMGTMVFYFGTDDQVPNTNAGTCLPDVTLNTGHRHLCWAFFDACFMNEYNRMPSMSFIVNKHLSLFDEATSKIETYDTNPAHALWHILVNKAGLPEEWLHPGDFLSVATTLFSENRGISILFDSHQPAQAYLESINNHVDNILRYGSDGKFHPKLIRYDYNPATLLPVIDESILLEEPTFSRRSWIDTINEVKVQYSEIVGEREAPSNDPYLVAWYKIDEGEGLTVHNSADPYPATKWPDMTIEGALDPPGTFWTHLPGFGSCDHGGGAIGEQWCRWVWEESTCEIGNLAASMGCFCRLEGFFGAYYAYPAFFTSEDSVNWAVESRLMEINLAAQILDIGGYHGGTALGHITPYQWTLNERKNKWQFIFILCVDGVTTINAIKEDGTRIIGNGVGGLGANNTVKQFRAFRTYKAASFSYPSMWGQVSDIIIYADKILTLEDWAAWYDRLRERYGMAARSGW